MSPLKLGGWQNVPDARETNECYDPDFNEIKGSISWDEGVENDTIIQTLNQASIHSKSIKSALYSM